MTSEAKTKPDGGQAGNFLVATPFLVDTPYRRSVVLVMRHDSRSALGFVMNDRLRSGLAQLDEFLQMTMQRGGGSPATPFPGIQMFSAVIRWGPGKLDREMDQGIWMATPARLESALGRGDLWTSLLRQIGRDVLRDGLGIKSFPANPNLN